MTVIPLIALGLIAKSVFDRSAKLNNIQRSLQNRIDELSCGSDDAVCSAEVW